MKSDDFIIIKQQKRQNLEEHTAIFTSSQSSADGLICECSYADLQHSQERII